MEIFLQSLASGLLIGGLYAIIGIGMTLIMGVLKIINLAHGQILMVSMYITWVLWKYVGIDPYLSIFITIPFVFVFAEGLSKYLLYPLIEKDSILPENQVLMTVGIGMVLVELARSIFTSDFRSIPTSYTDKSIYLGNISLSDFISQKKPIIVIDHHEKIEQAEEIAHSIINAETSTAEMIGKIYEKLEIALEPEIATSLLTGILFDTRRFIYRTASTFNTVQFLIHSGGNYDEALSILQKEPSKSEKIARLKGVTRTLIHKEGADIYALTHVSSYESSVARALIGLGASFAVVLAVPSDNEYRISMRCTKTFAERNKISLGTLANVISANFEGSGGGHQTAAGINFREPKEFPKKKNEIVQMLLKMLLKEIKQK